MALVAGAENGEILGAAPPRSTALVGKSVCFTGAQPKKRSILETMITDNGGEVRDSVTAGLTYLVMADPNSKSSKAKKAKELGTECLDLASLEAKILEAGGVVD